VQKIALKGYARGETPITCRPAEVLEPELEKAKADVKDLAVDLDDVLIYALYPVTGKKFLGWKYGKETPPPEVKAKTMEEVKAEEALVKKALAGELVEKKKAPEKGENVRTFNVFVNDEYFEVGVEDVGGAPVIGYAQRMAAPASAAPRAAATKPAAAQAATAAAPKAAAVEGTPMAAPMPGMIVRYEKKEGDAVKKGDTVVVLEAMKMENPLTAPADGTIKCINFKSGDSVAKGDTLCVIG
jgi:pyruvate carboxylase subunit B